MSEISGVVHRLQGSISPAMVHGIIIAWLAKLNALGDPAAILFGGLLLAGRRFSFRRPAHVAGIILFTVIASDVLLRYRIRIVKR